jgi:alcohol dehydrogenase class IV
MKPEILSQLRKYVVPEMVFGTGARFLTGRYLENFNIRNTMIVTDPGVREAGWLDDVINILNEQKTRYIIFDQVTPNPRDYEVMKGAEIYLENKCNGIIAVGGGSPLDAAKGIGIVANNGGHILNYEGVDEIPSVIPPLICIPTTSGSSADVSQFAIINDTNKKKKIAIISKALVPDISLIDPETTTTMDAELTAATGLDALTHAIEALVSNARSPLTDLNALEAIRLVFVHLINAIHNPKDLEARKGMSLASLLAGMAFSNASLGAVHAMAHALGGLLDLPHGKCNAILLPHVITSNYDSCPDQYNKIGEITGITQKEMSDSEKKGIIIQQIKNLTHQAGITDTLSDLHVSQEAMNALTDNALKDACIYTNPKDLSFEELRGIYESAK